MEKLTLLKDFNNALWFEHDLSHIDKVFRPDTRVNGVAGGLSTGPDEFRDFITAVHELMAVEEIKYEYPIEQGDILATIMCFEAKDRVSGRPIVFDGQVMCKIVDGFFVEFYLHFDTMSFYEQLGLLPENSLELGLTGERIA